LTSAACVAARPSNLRNRHGRKSYGFENPRPAPFFPFRPPDGAFPPLAPRHLPAPGQQPARGVHYRNPWAAAFLSLIPGLGQLYNHQPKKALTIFLFAAACLALAAATLYHPFSNYILMGCLLAWFTAFTTGWSRPRGSTATPCPGSTCWPFTAPGFIHRDLLPRLSIRRLPFPAPVRYLPYAQLTPYLNEGERFTIAMAPAPRLGDVVLCSPEALVSKIPGLRQEAGTMTGTWSIPAA